MFHPRSRRVAGSGAIALLFLLTATACAAGGRPARDDAVSVVARGADRTLGAHTFRFEATMGSDGFSSVMSGVVDLDQNLAGSAVGAGGLFPADQIMTQDGKVYQRREVLPRWAADVTTPWALIDGPELARKAGGKTVGLTAPAPGDPLLANGFDPATLLTSLRKTAERVERGSDETVRGVATTRYEVSLKPEQFLPDDMPAGFSAADVPVMHRAMAIWVGDDGLVRRIEDRISYALPGQAPGGPFTSKVEFFDFGIPVDLRVPAASETTDITDDAPTVTVPTPDPILPTTVKVWSAVASGAVDRFRWTLERGTATEGSVCNRLRVDPPVKVPAWTGTSALPSSLPSITPSAPPDPSVTPIAGLLSPSGQPYAVPPIPDSPDDTTGSLADAATVLGAGVGCDDPWNSAKGFVADADGLSWFFGDVPPGAEQGTARFADGTETPVPFRDGLFVLVHRSEPALKDLTFTRHGQPLQTCTVQADAAPLNLPPC